MINVVHFGRSRFYQIQKSILFPSLNKFYKSSRDELFKKCLSLKENHFSGDGRSDSPGYSAKYGTYSLMNTELNKVIDFRVVHVKEAGNSSLMEKAGLKLLLEKFAVLELPITTLTTDRHVQIRAFLKNDYPNIIHQFDVWHFSKSLKKSLSNLSKFSNNAPLKTWIKSVINHFWWCCATSDGNVEILRGKWLSILYHIRGIYTWEHNIHFHGCEHDSLEKQRKWLSEDSPAFQALKSVVEKKKTFDVFKYLVEFRDTGSLEVYHSLINKYCPKRLHFSIYGMIARTQLAVLDYNSGADNKQATKSDGSLCYKQVFSRVTQSWVVKKVMVEKTREYLQPLLQATISSSHDNETGGLPVIGELPPNIASIEKPDKTEAINNLKTRFSV